MSQPAKTLNTLHAPGALSPFDNPDIVTLLVEAAAVGKLSLAALRGTCKKNASFVLERVELFMSNVAVSLEGAVRDLRDGDQGALSLSRAAFFALTNGHFTDVVAEKIWRHTVDKTSSALFLNIPQARARPGCLGGGGGGGGGAFKVAAAPRAHARACLGRLSRTTRFCATPRT